MDRGFFITNPFIIMTRKQPWSCRGTESAIFIDRDQAYKLDRAILDKASGTVTMHTLIAGFEDVVSYEEESAIHAVEVGYEIL